MKRFLLWDYPRACWQYDVMVALILAFVFLTPRELFRDQPRANNIVMLPAEHGSSQFWWKPNCYLPFRRSNAPRESLSCCAAGMGSVAI